MVPLVRKSSLDKVSNPRFNPTFRIDNVPVVLHPLEIVSVSTDKLGKLAGSLKKESDRIIDALDELITRAWG